MIDVAFENQRKGYCKEQVNRYIEDLVARYEAASAAKDAEFARIKLSLEETKLQLASYKSECETVKSDKEKIAAVLIDAQARADEIIASARNNAEIEKNELVKQADDKRELLVLRNKKLRELRLDSSKVMEETKQHFEELYNLFMKKMDEDIAKFNEDIEIVCDRNQEDDGEASGNGEL